MKHVRWMVALLVGAVFLAACSGPQAGVEGAETSLVAALTASVEWDGQGSDSLRCDKLGESDERTADGWIHWIITSASGVTEAELVLGGSGSGTYTPTKYGPVVEFFTPYFDVATLTATLNYAGALGDNSQFVISDYCPGVVEEDDEELTVSKDAHTTFKRTHDWDVSKLVDPTSLLLFEDGTGDATVTWDIDVEYLGYNDSDWNVSGTITIENTGALDAVITAVEDVLAGDLIDLDCGEVVFPYTLVVGGTLTCTYDEDGFVEGKNVVTVTTERDEYGDEVDIFWGDPTTEIDATVDVQDVSDLFGTVDLGTVTAPNGDTYEYSEDFVWQDFGTEQCDEEFRYVNTVSLLDVAGAVLASADATLDVTISCDPPETDVLRVRKTADTSFAREHHWDLTKTVDVTYVKLVEDGSGDRTVTWTIDVEYLGALDAALVIFGEIEIENVSLRTTRSITSVMDDVGVAGVAPFAVACELEGEPVSLPFDLEPGEMLVCGYEVDVTAYALPGDDGTNTATVMASGEDDPLTATAGWSFGHASSEKNATVYLWDYSDLNGEWLFLEAFHAPTGGTVTYDHHFAWEDFQKSSGSEVTGQTVTPQCGDGTYKIGNWAKLFADPRPRNFLADYLVFDYAWVTVEVVGGTCGTAPTGELQ